MYEYKLIMEQYITAGSVSYTHLAAQDCTLLSMEYMLLANAIDCVPTR